MSHAHPISVFMRVASVHWAGYLVGLVASMAAVVICVHAISEHNSGITLYPTFGYGIRVVLMAAWLALIFGPVDFTIRKLVSRVAGRFAAHVAGLTLSLSVLAAVMLGANGMTEVAMLGTLCFAIGGLVGGMTRAVLATTLPDRTG